MITASATSIERDMAPYSATSVRKGAGWWFTLPMGLWLLAWSGINTGPWSFAQFGLGLGPTLNAIRAALPLAVLSIALIALLLGRSRQRSWAEKGFLLYGAVALFSCTGAENWFNQAYWGFAFLGVLAAMELALRAKDRVVTLERINILSWSITAVTLTVMLFLAREVLTAPGADGSAYGLLNRFLETHGYTISRETGLSRMAAVPAIISLVFALSLGGWRRLLSLGLFLLSAYVIWLMQSRGALFSFVGAFLFVLLYGHKRGRGKVLFFIATLASVLFLLFASQNSLNELWMHATRGTGSEGFVTQSGRLEIWADLLAQWAKAPLFGYGPQADRLFYWNAQNAFVYALLCGGIVGATGFVIAMLSAWRALARLARRAGELPAHERQMFQITGALLIFYTLRSIPENNAAVFSIDLLLQYPAMLYLVEAAKRGRAVIM